MITKGNWIKIIPEYAKFANQGYVAWTMLCVEYTSELMGEREIQRQSNLNLLVDIKKLFRLNEGLVWCSASRVVIILLLVQTQ
jgi:hypothetical protein